MDVDMERHVDNYEEEGKKTVNLLCPPYVVQDLIYEHLDSGSYLALRRTSLDTKCWMDRYSARRTNSMVDKFVDIQVEIIPDCGTSLSEGLPTIKNFLKSNLHPVTNFYIANYTGSEMYEEAEFIEFVKTHGSKIKKLKVFQYLDCSSDAELHFFNSLTNLDELTIQNVYTAQQGNGPVTRIPHCFESLKSLTHIEVFGEEGTRTEVDHWTLDPMKYCPNLERLSYLILNPDFSINSWYFDFRFYERKNEMVVFKENFINYLEAPLKPIRIKKLCLNHFNDYDGHFLELKTACELHGVKLSD